MPRPTNYSAEQRNLARRLNTLSAPTITRQVDYNTTSVARSMMRAAADYYRVNILDGVGYPLKAIVLRNEIPYQNINDTAEGRVLSMTTTAPPILIRVTARIPELHSMIPLPTQLGSNAITSPMDTALIDMHTTFVAINDTLTDPPVGSIILVDFGNRRDLSDSKYVGVVSSQTAMLGAYGMQALSAISSFTGLPGINIPAIIGNTMRDESQSAVNEYNPNATGLVDVGEEKFVASIAPNMEAARQEIISKTGKDICSNGASSHRGLTRAMRPGRIYCTWHKAGRAIDLNSHEDQWAAVQPDGDKYIIFVEALPNVAPDTTDASGRRLINITSILINHGFRRVPRNSSSEEWWHYEMAPAPRQWYETMLSLYSEQELMQRFRIDVQNNVVTVRNLRSHGVPI